MDLQQMAKEKVVSAPDTIEKTIALLRDHDLGNVYGLRLILERLKKAGIGMGKEKPPPRHYMDNEFIARLIKYAQTHILSEIKHDARIPIDKAYQLLGCADEGPAYIAEGHDPDKVICLKEGEIFGVCE